MAKTSKRATSRPAGRTAGGPGGASAKAGKQATKAALAGASEPGGGKGGGAIEDLKQDHRRVEKLFAEYHSSEDEEAKSRLVRQICRELIIHTKLEEEIFYPACREALSKEDMLDEAQAQVEHDSAKVLILELLQGDADDPYRDAKVGVLAEQVKHHVGEEEKPTEGIFAHAQARNLVTDELAQQLRERKQALQHRRDTLRPTPAVSFMHELGGGGHDAERFENSQGRFTKDGDRDRRRFMMSGLGDDDHDDRGRFMRVDDEGSGRRERYGMGQGREPGGSERWRAVRHAEDHRSGRSDGYVDCRGGDRRQARDEYGHRDDEERSRGIASRDRDDNYRRRDHGQGGWFGDAEGHSRSRWEDEPGGSGGSSRGRDEGGERGQGRSGWFGDSRGHGEASRRGWRGRR